jgi:uncharacterized delta-60 repeat protein
MLGAPAARAAPGDLDPTFSFDGKLTTDIGTATAEAFDLAVQSDGKLVVVGGAAGDVALARYHADGALDTTFSGDGLQTTDLSPALGGARGVAIQPDGNIVVVGVSNTDGDSDFAIVRYKPDGALDTTFSGDGLQTTDFGGTDSASDVVLQPGGAIVAMGGADSDFALARYTPAGMLDTTFSGDGKQTTDFGGHDQAAALALTPGGGIVAVGGGASGAKGGFRVARYDANGTLDTGFSGDGKQETVVETESVAGDVAVQSDGRIVVAGSSADGSTVNFGLVRYLVDGSLDMSFSGDGKQATDFGTFDEGFGVALEPGGKIVVAGRSGNATPDFALARYLSDGSPDSAFSDDGRQTTDIRGDFDLARAVVLQGDGKYVAAGSSRAAGRFAFAVARYEAVGAPPQCSDSADNDGDTATDYPADQGCESASDGSESPNAPQCSDRLDNDGDGQTNHPADQGCESATDASESPDAPQCSDRLDNDGDGKTNYPADQGCESPTDASESPDAPDTRITSGPEGPTNDTTPTYGFAAEPAAGATFECWMDAGTPAPCVAPFTAGPLAEGAHIFHVRARTPGGPVDGTPATRNVFVDTVAPSTTIAVTPRAGLGTRIGTGETYSGYVDITRSAQDPEPSGGVAFLGCTMDPPTAPVRGEDILGSSCPLITDAAGDHTVYAASRDAAGNVGPIAVARFRIQGPPDTTITGGPNGPTWDTTPSFTFTSDTDGATFQCRVDAGTWTPCTSPFTTAEITGRGSHFFQVAAIGPGGVVDPTPARRDFTVSSLETRTYGCRVQPFRPLKGIAGYNGCTVEPADRPCSFAYATCTTETVPCPIGARCTFKTRVTHVDQDGPGLGWGSYTGVSFKRPVPGTIVSGSGDEMARAGCLTHGGPAQCSATSSVTIIGDGRPLFFICGSIGALQTSGARTSGPDEARVLDCGLTIEIRAADVLDATTQGESFSVYVTGAGTLTAAPAGSSRARISAAANKPKPRPLFRTTRKRAKRAGPVTFKLALSKGARSTLRKRKKLALTLRLTFKPTSGKTTTRTVKLTLRPPPKAPKVPKGP